MAHSSTVVGLLFTAALASCGGQTPRAESSSRASAWPHAIAKYTGFSAPESVVYDAEADRYLVSNVNGAPSAEDNNGFVSVLSPDGRVTDLKWIEGGKNGIKLDAPKGLAIAEGVLYVADIGVVRQFDAKNGAYKGEIAVPGSTFLSDVSSDAEGNVYVTDAGPPRGTFDAVGTEAVYIIERGRPKLFAKGSALGRPTSVLWTEGGVVVVPFGSNEVYRLDGDGVKKDVTKIPAGGLAGVVQLGDWLFVTSWQASSVFRGKLGGRFEVALADQKSPADLGYDSRRARLLVPHFTEDSVDVFELR